MIAIVVKFIKNMFYLKFKTTYKDKLLLLLYKMCSDNTIIVMSYHKTELMSFANI